MLDGSSRAGGNSRDRRMLYARAREGCATRVTGRDEVAVVRLLAVRILQDTVRACKFLEFFFAAAALRGSVNPDGLGLL